MTQAQTIRLLIADDHPVIRAAIGQFLDMQSDMTVVGMASNGAEAVELAMALRPDVVLMDYAMPGKGGAAATREIRSNDPHIVVVSYSIHEDERVTTSMLEAGAAFHVSKHTENAALLAAIREHAGTWLSITDPRSEAETHHQDSSR